MARNTPTVNPPVDLFNPPPPGSPPELVLKWLSELLGGEREALEFMRKAPGCRFEIPSQLEIERLRQDRMILRRLNSDPSTDAMGHLCDFTGRDRRSVGKVFADKHGRGIGSARQRKAA